MAQNALPHGSRIERGGRMAFLLRQFPWLRAWLIRVLFPALAGADDGDGNEGGEGGGEGNKEGKPAGDDDGDKGGTEKTAEQYREELRKSDRVRKREADKAAKRIQQLERDLKEREDADKSEIERQIEAARQEGESKAKGEADKQIRSTRLEVAVTRLATKGIKVPDPKKEGEEKTVRFRDSDDALAYIERQVARGDLDADEIFDEDGKVKNDGLSSALKDLLEAKPHWADGDAPSSGDPGLGKGEPAESDLEKMSVEAHLDRQDPGRKK